MFKHCLWIVFIWNQYYKSLVSSSICQRIQTEKTNQGQYCPSLRFNYLSINTDLEKLLPQLYHTNMKICYEQCYIDIEIVIATKWHWYLFNLQPYFLGTGSFLHNQSQELVPPIPALTFMKFQQNLWERFWDILGLSFYG